jgi:transposase
VSDLYWLTDEQMARLEPYFPKSHGRPRVDDRRVLSGIIFVNRNGLRWRDAPKDYGPHKTLYNRWKRWGAAGVFTRMMEGLSSAGADRKTVDDRRDLSEGAPHGIIAYRSIGASAQYILSNRSARAGAWYKCTIQLNAGVFAGLMRPEAGRGRHEAGA